MQWISRQEVDDLSTFMQQRKALEIDLADGLDRLQEFTLMMTMNADFTAFEILSIGPETTAAEERPAPAKSSDNIIPLQGQMRKTA